MDRQRIDGRRLPLLVILAGLAGITGCVERRYTIRSNPPGALAIVNGEEIGPTPVSHSFTFYGDREVTLMLDGYQTQTIIQPIRAPWWDNLLTEFFSENLVPVSLRDERDFSYNLAPKTIPPPNDLLGRAQGLRAQAQVFPPPRPRGFFAWLGF